MVLGRRAAVAATLWAAAAMLVHGNMTYNLTLPSEPGSTELWAAVEPNTTTGVWQLVFYDGVGSGTVFIGPALGPLQSTAFLPSGFNIGTIGFVAHPGYHLTLSVVENPPPPSNAITRTFQTSETQILDAIAFLTQQTVVPPNGYADLGLLGAGNSWFPTARKSVYVSSTFNSSTGWQSGTCPLRETGDLREPCAPAGVCCRTPAAGGAGYTSLSALDGDDDDEEDDDDYYSYYNPYNVTSHPPTTADLYAAGELGSQYQCSCGGATSCFGATTVYTSAQLFANAPFCTDTLALYFDHNQLTEVPIAGFAGLVNVRDIDLSSNDLFDLPEPTATHAASLFASCQTLSYLDLSRNSLTRIKSSDFDGATALTVLFLQNNAIESVDAALSSQLAQLVHLDLNNNRLPNITFVRGLTSLQELRVSSNVIAELNGDEFAGFTALERLELSENAITELSVGVFGPLTALRRLELSHNSISLITSDLFATNTEMRQLDLDNNAIADISALAFRSLDELEELHLQSNRLTSLSTLLFAGCNDLEILDLSNNTLEQLQPGLLERNTDLSELYLSRNRLRFIAHDTVGYSSSLATVTFDGNVLAGCTYNNTTPSVDCSFCTVSTFILSESTAFECCIEPGFSSCDAASRFGLQVNTTFNFTPALASVPVLFVNEPYRFQAPSNKSALFRDFAGSASAITYTLVYTSTRPPEGDVLIAPESGIILTIPSSTGVGNFSAIFYARDAEGIEVEVARWAYTVTTRPPITLADGLGFAVGPLLPQKLSINETYTFQPFAYFLASGNRTTDPAVIYDNAVGNTVSYRLDVQNTETGTPLARVGDFLIDTASAFVSARPAGTPYNATVTFIATDTAGRDVQLVVWTVEVVFRDTAILTNGPNGRGCENGGLAVDVTEHDNRFSCSCDNTLFTGQNCEQPRGVPTLTVTLGGQQTGISLVQTALYNQTRWAIGQDYRIAPPIITSAFTTSETGVNTSVDVSQLTYSVSPLPTGFFSNPSTGEIIGVFDAAVNETSVITVELEGASPSPPIATIEFQALFPDVALASNGPGGQDCANAHEREDLIPFDGRFTCVCGETSTFWGPNCDVPLPSPVLSIEIGDQFIPDGARKFDYSFYNQSNWAVSESHRVAPVHILSANITRTLSSGTLLVESVNVSELTFSVTPLPDNFFVDVDTAEMIGVPDEEFSIVSTVTANFAFARPAIVANITFNFRVADTAVASNGPNGQDCQSTDQRVDVVPFNDAFTCNCSARGVILFTGPNCKDPLTSASAAGGDGASGAEYGYAIGAIVVLCILLVTIQQVRLYRERNKPVSLSDMQGDILKELGTGVEIDIHEHEVGVSLLFESLSHVVVLNDVDEARLGAQVIDSVQRLKGFSHLSTATSRVKVQQSSDRMLLIVPRPDGAKGVGYEDDLVGAIRKAIHRGGLTAGDHLVVKDAVVAVPTQVPREIPRSHVLRLQLLGEGNFGEVFKAMLTDHGRSGMSRVVAAKSVKGGSESTRDDLLREAAIMSLFNHPNLVSLVGVVTIPRTVPVIVLLEFCENGTLLDHVTENEETAHMLLTFCADVARGLRYLSSRSIVHRDVAARNILLDAAKHCKVADFGMSIALPNADAAAVDETYASNYVRLQGELPVRWCAIETLSDGKYSRATDVWSFGVLVYEVMSRGHVPYSECATLMEVGEYIKAGRCLSCPPGCSEDIYSTLMMPCWKSNPHERPGFTELLHACVSLGASDDMHKVTTPVPPLPGDGGSVLSGTSMISGENSKRSDQGGWRKKWRKTAAAALTNEERSLLGVSVHHLERDLLPAVLTAATPVWLKPTLSEKQARKSLSGSQDGTFLLIVDPTVSGAHAVVVVQGNTTIRVPVLRSKPATSTASTITSVDSAEVAVYTFESMPKEEGAPTLVGVLKRAMNETVSPFQTKLVPKYAEEAHFERLPDDPMDVEISHAVSLVVKPQTKNVRCPRDGELGSSYVDALESVDSVGKSIALLSYTWAYQLMHVVQALNRWVATSAGDSKRAYIWICSLCLNQHRIVKALSPEELAAEFGPRVISIGQLLPMLDPWRKPIYMSRAWCLFELYTAIQKNVKTNIILTEKQEAEFLKAIATEGYGAMDDALRSIRSEDAVATEEADLIAIQGYVKSVPGGFEQLNHKIKHHLQEWCASHGAVRSANRLEHRERRQSEMNVNKFSRETHGTRESLKPLETTHENTPFRGLASAYTPRPVQGESTLGHYYPESADETTRGPFLAVGPQLYSQSQTLPPVDARTATTESNMTLESGGDDYMVLMDSSRDGGFYASGVPVQQSPGQPSFMSSHNDWVETIQALSVPADEEFTLTL